MLHKTKGIVLRFTRYGETSIIVNIFTEAFGLQGYIVNSVRKSGKGEMAFFQPLTLLDMVVYHKNQPGIVRIKEKKCFYPYQNLSGNVKKAAIAMFLTELLNKILHEDVHSPEVYHYLEEFFISLDQAPDHCEDFHLYFMVNISRLLGFGINQPGDLIASFGAAPEILQSVQELLDTPSPVDLTFTVGQRRAILDLLIHFYNVHVHEMGELKSLRVLREILN